MIKENIRKALEGSILIGIFLKILTRLKNLRIFIIAGEFIISLKERLKTAYKNSILYSLVKLKESEKDFYSESIAFKMSEKTASRVYERTRRYHEDSRILKIIRTLEESFRNINSRNIGIIIVIIFFINTLQKFIFEEINFFGFSMRIRIIFFLAGILLILHNSDFNNVLKNSYIAKCIQRQTKK